MQKLIKPLTQSLCIIMVYFVILNLTGCKEQITGFLDPKGIIAHEERRLFFDTLALMLIVVLPVIIMSFAFVYHYQASHRIKAYKPNWSHSVFLESLWWGIPCVIILVLAILTWKKTHELDPYRRITGASHDPLLIQVIALPWKWLFIYPKQNIATVNYLVIPLNQQVEFWITADNVPMSAFFIPQLGSQIYAMAGMRTRLHLLAGETGTYEGLNALFNGDGFSDMHFPVHVVSVNDMTKWLEQVKKSTQQLTDDAYSKLLNPTINDAPKMFSGVNTNLFDHVIMVYMNTIGPIHPRHNQLKYSPTHS